MKSSKFAVRSVHFCHKIKVHPRGREMENDCVKGNAFPAGDRERRGLIDQYQTLIKVGERGKVASHSGSSYYLKRKSNLTRKSL